MCHAMCMMRIYCIFINLGTCCLQLLLHIYKTIIHLLYTIYVIGIDGEIDFSLIGTASGVLSSVFVSLNSIFTATALPKVNNDKSALLFYNNFNAVVLFIPLIAMFESQVSCYRIILYNCIIIYYSY